MRTQGIGANSTFSGLGRDIAIIQRHEVRMLSFNQSVYKRTKILGVKGVFILKHEKVFFR
jgi:hypothetical protein